MLLGNSGSPRWYMGSPERLDAYLTNLQAWGATSTELVLHHGPADERTARVHVLEPDWESMIRRYRALGIACQFHVSLDGRFATARWCDDADALGREYAPLLRVVGDTAGEQGSAVLVLHGADDPDLSPEANRDATLGLLRWLAERIETLPGDVRIGLELGAVKAHRPTAAARSRDDVLSLAEEVRSPKVGICWDLAHDRSNADHERGWSVVPSPSFLARVVHVHLHDLDDNGVAHYPLVFDHVPFREQLPALERGGDSPPVTMEIRWRCAARLGEPWDLLGRCYAIAASVIRPSNGRR